MTHIWPLSYFIRESYNTPERVYRLAKARGMDLVAITDHDTIEGALTLAHFPDVIVGCEVSAHFPGHHVDAPPRWPPRPGKGKSAAATRIAAAPSAGPTPSSTAPPRARSS